MPHPAMSLAILLGALALDAAIGDPPAVVRAVGHPVTWMGALIGRLDGALNRTDAAPARRRRRGVLALALLLAAALAPTIAAQSLLLACLPVWAAWAALTAAASSLLAQRSLHQHVGRVAEALQRDGLAAGRAAVSHIVGRDPASLDAAGVARAAIESLAENFSDGVVAPAFWCAVGGLPGIAAYKMANTADSMIGHRTARHAAFGWAAARFDDLVNLPASRLAALFLIAAAALTRDADAAAAWGAVRRDAPGHRSPNAGWPEAAMAGALGLRLAGPRTYGGSRVEDGWMGQGTPQATAADIRRALALYRRACAVQAALVALLLCAGWLANPHWLSAPG